MERRSASLIITETQSKTAIRYHRTSLRLGTAKRNLQGAKAAEHVGKRQWSYTLPGNVNCCSHYGDLYGPSCTIAKQRTHM